MNKEAQRIAIARVCGLKIRKVIYNKGTAEVWVSEGREPIPDYLGDLNAMHEAESTLHRNGPEFSRMLLELVGEAAGPGVMYAYGSFSHVHAPARLRAEAFLRTLGKWEEVQG